MFVMNYTFVANKHLSILSNTSKNIRTTLQLFGQEEQDKPYFVSEGAGLMMYPEEGFRADFYIYAICIAGTARISLNNQEIGIKANHFFAAIPSTVIQVFEHSKNFKAKVLVFEKSFLLRNILDARQLEHLGFFSFDTLAHIDLDKEAFQLLKNKLDIIYNKTKEDGLFRDQIIQSLIFNLLFETADIFFKNRQLVRKKALSREDELFMKFMKLVQFNFKTQQELSFYADKLFISPKYLIQLCKNISGKTPGNILSETLVNEARLLLKMPDNNISTVSTALNYSSVAAFSKFFKKHTGFSPSAFRQQ